MTSYDVLKDIVAIFYIKTTILGFKTYEMEAYFYAISSVTNKLFSAKVVAFDTSTFPLTVIGYGFC